MESVFNDVTATKTWGMNALPGSDLYQVEGRNPVLEALKAMRAKKILVVRGVRGEAKIQDILRLAGDGGTPVDVVSKKSLDAISESGRHQGVIAFVELPKPVSLRQILVEEKGDVCVVLLDRVHDPMNLGSILRTAEATGVRVVVIPKKGSVGLTPSVLRASMGGGLHVPVIRDNLFQAVKLLKREGLRVVGVDPTGAVDFFDERLTGALALVLGGEDRGINTSLLDRCDVVVRIPVVGHITSLNVGVAAAIVLYDRLRQRILEVR